MIFFILLIIIGGLVWWGLWLLFIKSAVWTVKPLIEYFKEKEEYNTATDNDVPKEDAAKIVIKITSLQKNGTFKEDRIEVDLPKKDQNEKGLNHV
mgnify:CR=1 FL=1